MPPPEPRNLVAADIPRILGLEADLFGPEAWTRGMYREELASPYRAYRGIDESDLLVAWGGVLLAEDAQILTIGVDRGHQRRGFGGALLRDLLAIAARLGARQVFLEVRASDDVARRLYERHGFAAIGVRRNYYAVIGEDALVMRAVLPRSAQAVPPAARRPDAGPKGALLPEAPDYDR